MTELLRKLLNYDPDTGVLTWKARPLSMFSTDSQGKRWNSRYAGKLAFTANADGYKLGKVFGASFRAHRVAWAIHHGEWPSGEIDHINRVKSDNRIANLRDVTKSENMRNTQLQKNNTSGHVGVCWCAQSRKWLASIRANSKQVHIGLFDNKADAINARMAASLSFGYHENHGRPSQ